MSDNDKILTVIGMHYHAITDEVRREMVRTLENNPDASLRDIYADLSRRFNTMATDGAVD